MCARMARKAGIPTIDVGADTRIEARPMTKRPAHAPVWPVFDLAGVGKWHGWKSPHGGPSLHVHPLEPGAIPALYVIDGTKLDVLAHFRSEDAALRTQRMLDEWMGVRDEWI